MTFRKQQIAGFVVAVALAGFGCHRERSFDSGQPGIDNRKLPNGVHLLEDGVSCAVDYPVVRLSKGHKDMVGWYSTDGHKFRIDFEAGKGPFKNSDMIETRMDSHVVWGGPLKDDVTVDHYFPYSVTLDGANQPCKTAQPSKSGDYDPGLYVTR